VKVSKNIKPIYDAIKWINELNNLNIKVL